MFCKAIDVKNNYRNSDYSSLNKNAYVGGDAYNYIINAGYFSGYMAAGSGFLISAVLCGCFGSKSNEGNILPNQSPSIFEENREDKIVLPPLN